MDKSATPGSAPPYEPNPQFTSAPQPTQQQYTGTVPGSQPTSYSQTPAQPMMHQDSYHGQQMTPAQSPPIQNSPPIQYSQHPMGSPPPGQAKQEYFGPGQPGSQPMEMQHTQSGHQIPQMIQVPMQQVSQYQTAIPLQSLGEAAAPVDCPVCRARDLTRVEYHNGNTVLAWAALICFCCCLGCIPFMMRQLKDVEHHCGKCGVLLATWHNSGRTVVHAHG